MFTIVLERVGRDVQELLDVIEAVGQRLGDPRQLVDVVPSDSRLSATKLCTSPTALLRSRDGVGDLVGVVGQQPGDRRQILVELRASGRAVLQRRNQDRQVLDGGEDVGAVVAERRKGLRQFDHGVADVGALATQIVGGGVDERAQRTDAAGLGRLQLVGQPLQLLAEVVLLHRNSGALPRDHRVVLHRPARRCMPVSAGWRAR